eukprot:scaffold5106_cov15-Tisochrysis_lutea.AAC.1
MSKRWAVTKLSVLLSHILCAADGWWCSLNGQSWPRWCCLVSAAGVHHRTLAHGARRVGKRERLKSNERRQRVLVVSMALTSQPDNPRSFRPLPLSAQQTVTAHFSGMGHLPNPLISVFTTSPAQAPHPHPQDPLTCPARVRARSTALSI